MRIEAVLAGACVGLLAGCATPATADSSSLYAEPRRFIGNQVRVCGHMVSVDNVWEEPPTQEGSARRGLAVVRGDDDVNFEPAYRCLSGEIVYVGCGRDGICFGRVFDYGIKVTAEALSQADGAKGR